MVNKKEILSKLVDQGMKTGEHTHMRPVIEKELLHYDILFALDKERLLDQLTFQGGTSLRLCYGAVRFSEDLDFVGGRDFATGHLLPDINLFFYFEINEDKNPFFTHRIRKVLSNLYHERIFIQ